MSDHYANPCDPSCAKEMYGHCVKTGENRCLYATPPFGPAAPAPTEPVTVKTVTNLPDSGKPTHFGPEPVTPSEGEREQARYLWDEHLYRFGDPGSEEIEHIARALAAARAEGYATGRGAAVLAGLKKAREDAAEVERWRNVVPVPKDTTRHTPESLHTFVFELLTALVDASATFEKIAAIWRGNGACGYSEAEAYRLACGGAARLYIARSGDYTQSNPAELRALLAKALDALTYGHAFAHSEWDRACLLSGRYCDPYLSSENAWVDALSNVEAKGRSDALEYAAGVAEWHASLFQHPDDADFADEILTVAAAIRAAKGGK